MSTPNNPLAGNPGPSPVVLGWTSFILQLTPVVLQLITQIEGMFPDKGRGQAKKKIVTAAVTSALPVAARPVIKDTLSEMIDAQVSTLNETGVFGK